MNFLKKPLKISSFLLALSAVSLPTVAQPQDGFAALYFAQTVFAGDIRGTTINVAVLNDDDLTRGNNSNESIFQSLRESSNNTPLQIFNGTLSYDLTNFRVVPVSGESSVTVYFNDGSILDDVLAIRDNFLVYGVSTSLFLLEQSKLIEAGKTINDIVEVSVNEAVNHDLNYSDLGFTLASELPPLEEEPETPSDSEENNSSTNTIVGTSGRDNLQGTEEDDVINGRGGSRDVLTGNNGQDFFVFGSEAGNENKDRDVIVDFDTIDDTLVLENGASIASTTIRNNSTIIRLAGRDRDTIRLRGVTLDISLINVIRTDSIFE